MEKVKLYLFKELTNIYNQIINAYSRIKPGNVYPPNLEVNVNLNLTIKMLCINASLVAMQLNEEIKKLDLGIIDEDDEKFPTLQQIFQANDLKNSPENRKQFRNALAHSEFINFYLDENEKNIPIPLIELDNGKIHCYVDMLQLSNIVSYYENIYKLCDSRKGVNIYCIPSLSPKDNVKDIFLKKVRDTGKVININGIHDPNIKDNIDEVLLEHITLMSGYKPSFSQIIMDAYVGYDYLKNNPNANISENSVLATTKEGIELVKIIRDSKFDRDHFFESLATTSDIAGIILTSVEQAKVFGRTRETLEAYKRYNHINRFSCTVQKFDDNFMDFFGGYINYVGFNGLKNCEKENAFQKVKIDLASCYFERKNNDVGFSTPILVASYLVANPYNSILQNGLIKDVDLNQEIKTYNFYETPLLYNSFLMDYAGYMISFVKGVYDEYKEKTGKELFKYDSISVSKQSYTCEENLFKVKYSNQEEIDKVDYQISLSRNIASGIKRRIINNNSLNRNPKKYASITEMENNIREYGLDNYAKMLDYLADFILKDCTHNQESNNKKRMILRVLNKLINQTDSYEHSDKKSNLTEEELKVRDEVMAILSNCETNKSFDSIIPNMNEMQSVKKELMDKGKYIDAAQFIRHFRNCLAHGNYEVNYQDAFAKKDLSKIKYKFYDIDEDGNQCFEFRCNGKKLLEILNSIQKSISDQLDPEFFDYPKDKKMTLSDFMEL